MIDPELYLAFVLATVLLMLIPGPNVSLIVANSVARGTRYGVLTVAGTASATVVQLALVGFGLTTILTRFAGLFEQIRWAGVAYLVYLGIRQWRAASRRLADGPRPERSAQAIYVRGFLISLTNPKTLLFYGAFLPQFMVEGRGVTAQLALLSATVLVIAATVDCGWAALAGRARGILSRRERLRNRVSGGFMMLAGAGLALARAR